MQLTVTIPDDVADRLGPSEAMARRALEAFVLEEFRSGRLQKSDLRRLLALQTVDALDGFLKAHQVYEQYTLADFDEEREELRRLGF
jgi:hypothetical protein